MSSFIMRKNTASGVYALNKAKTYTQATDNTAIGYNAANKTQSKECSAFGAYSLEHNQTGENTALGAWASNKTTGTGNTSVEIGRAHV